MLQEQASRRSFRTALTSRPASGFSTSSRGIAGSMTSDALSSTPSNARSCTTWPSFWRKFRPIFSSPALSLTQIGYTAARVKLLRLSDSKIMEASIGTGSNTCTSWPAAAAARAYIPKLPPRSTSTARGCRLSVCSICSTYERSHAPVAWIAPEIQRSRDRSNVQILKAMGAMLASTT